MTDDQLSRIAGLFSGVQLALVHMGNMLVSRGVISHDDLASSFRDTADNVSTNTANREVISLVLCQVARGIAESNLQASPEQPEEPQKAILRLIQGGNADPSEQC